MLIWVSQIIPLGISLLNFTNEFPRLNTLTWLVLGSSFMAMLLGWAIAAVMVRTPSSPEWELDHHKLKIGALFLVGLYAFSILVGISSSNGFPLLTEDPDRARSLFMVGRIQNIAFAAGIPAFIILIHLALNGRRILEKITWYTLLACIVASYLLIGSRFMTLIWLCLLLTYWDLHIKRLPILRIMSIILLFVGAFIIVGYYRYGRELAMAYNPDKVAKIGATFAITSVYNYIANAYWNTDYALSLWNRGLLNLPTWGLSTNEGLLWTAGLLPGLQQAYGLSGALNPDVTLRAGLNATTYHWGLFKDFGASGPIIGSFGMGWLLTYLYRRHCAIGSLPAIFMYGVLAYFAVGSFNLLASVIPTPIFGIILLAIVMKLCTRRQIQTQI